MGVLDIVENPKIIEAMATIASFVPAPVGPVLAAALRLAKTWIEQRTSAEEIQDVLKKYGVEAQGIADNW